MTDKDLKSINLETPLYHPFLGKGFAENITPSSVKVIFSEGVCVTFSKSYTT